jgi:glycosyltransferase involved in cell wall biosynthesis
VLIVSLGSTGGLRAADEQLRESLARAGASVALVCVPAPPPIRTLALTDLRWAHAARHATLAALQELRVPPRSIIYSSTTAALLWPRPGVIRFDATAAANRPGRHGVWQRPLERRRLAQAPLLLPWSEGALDEIPGRLAGKLRQQDRAVVLPVSVDCSAREHRDRDIAAITYGANPLKKGLDRVLRAFLEARRPTEELVVAGSSAAELQQAGIHLPAQGVRALGMLDPHQYRDLLRRARVFVCAPRREDYGIAQLQALAEGCQLVTTPSQGPYVALPIARAVDRRLVGEDLSAALRDALDAPRSDYAERAAELLASVGPEVVERLVADELLPRLL